MSSGQDDRQANESVETQLPGRPDATQRMEEDPRARAAASRRIATRQRLIECAIDVFAQRGATGAVIDDFIVPAGVARGTFYNHFVTTAELLQAVVAALGDEIVALIDPMLQPVPSPAERLAMGIRFYLVMAERSSVLASFVTSVGTRSGAMGELVERYMGRDLEAGRAQGLFDFEHAGAARDLLMGCAMQCIESLHTGRHPLAEVTTSLQMALRGIGLPQDEAFRVCAQPLPLLQPSHASILWRLLSFDDGVNKLDQ